MQKLELVDDRFPDMVNGQKTNTLRWKEGEVKEGYLLFYATKNPSWKALVWVTNVRNIPMDQIAYVYDMSPQELHKAMLRHYPDINIDSNVSYIEYLSPIQTLEKKGIPENFEEKVITEINVES